MTEASSEKPKAKSRLCHDALQYVAEDLRVKIDTLFREIAVLREALEIYGTSVNWDCTGLPEVDDHVVDDTFVHQVGENGWELARRALSQADAVRKVTR